MANPTPEEYTSFLADFKEQLKKLESRLNWLEERARDFTPHKTSFESKDVSQSVAVQTNQFQPPPLSGAVNNYLESNLESPRIEPVLSDTLAQDHKPQSDAIKKTIETIIGSDVVEPTSFSKSSEPVTDKLLVSAPEAEQSSLETRIGSFWLNRLGLVALLVGVVSLLLYSFQFFGPVVKIAFGFLFAFAVVFLGRKLSLKDGREWFGHGLNALGWSIAYFTGYAMYFIPELQVIHSMLLELLIVFALAAGTMYDAIKAKSEFTAILSSAFASLAICLSATSINPIFALTVVLVAIAIVAIFQHWYTLLLSGTIAYYISYYYCANPLVLWCPAPTLSSLEIMWPLVLAWAAIYISIYFAQQTTALRSRLIGTSLINVLCFTSFICSNMRIVVPSESVPTTCSWVLLALGMIYLGTAKQFKRKGFEDLWSTHLLIGLSLVNWSKLLHYNNSVDPFLYLMQIGLLAVFGVRFKIKAFEFFALALALLAMPIFITNGLIVGALATIVYGTITYLYRQESIKEPQLGTTQRTISNYYFTLGNLIAGLVICFTDSVSWSWKEFIWLAQTAINSYYTLRTKDDFCNAIVGGMLLLITFILLFSVGSLEPVVSILCISGLYAFSLYSRKVALGGSDALSFFYKNFYAGLASLLLATFLYNRISHNWISTAICIEGVALLTAGFIFREKPLRIYGLIAFGLLGFHLLFIDLASAPTIARIISFIASGLVLLGCSYAYTSFNKKSPGVETSNNISNTKL